MIRAFRRWKLQHYHLWLVHQKKVNFFLSQHYRCCSPVFFSDLEVVEVWSKKHPRMAKGCCGCFVRCMDRQVSPEAPFSHRHPAVASVLPGKVVDWLDYEYPPAKEHFALPVRMPDAWKLGIAIVSIIVCGVMLLFATGLTTYSIIQQAQTNSTSGNSTCG